MFNAFHDVDNKKWNIFDFSLIQIYKQVRSQVI